MPGLIQGENQGTPKLNLSEETICMRLGKDVSCDQQSTGEVASHHLQPDG
jgi:hypothetical protein